MLVRYKIINNCICLYAVNQHDIKECGLVISGSILLGSTPERSETSVCITASAFLKTGKKSSALKGPIGKW